MKVAAEHAGRRARCPSCRVVLVIPSSEELATLGGIAPLALEADDSAAAPAVAAALARGSNRSRKRWWLAVAAMCLFAVAALSVIPALRAKDPAEASAAAAAVPSPSVAPKPQPKPELPPPTAKLPRRPPSTRPEDAVIPLPGLPLAAFRAAGGRYLMVHCAEARQLVVFDVHERRIARTLELPTVNTVCAAGAKDLLLIVPEAKEIQRWNLSTFQMEAKGDLPEPVHADMHGPEDRVRGFAMGSDSAGPALLVLIGRGSPILIEPGTLATFETQRSPPPVSPKSHDTRDGVRVEGAVWFLAAESDMELYASADGSTFAARRLWITPEGVFLLSIAGPYATRDFYNHRTVGAVVPNWDGSRICTSLGVYTTHMAPRWDDPSAPPWPGRPPPRDYQKVIFLPGPRPPLLIRVTRPALTEADRDRNNPQRPRPMRLDVVADVNAPPLGALPAVPEFDGLGDEVGEPGLAQRIHWFMDQKLLVTIPVMANQNPDSHRPPPFSPTDPAQARLVMRGCDFEPTLNQASGAKVMVDSTPPLMAARGQKWTYPMYALCASGDAVATLESAPPGMTLSASGVLEWSVPAGYEEPRVGVILSVVGAGERVYQSFTLEVR